MLVLCGQVIFNTEVQKKISILLTKKELSQRYMGGILEVIIALLGQKSMSFRHPANFNCEVSAGV